MATTEEQRNDRRALLDIIHGEAPAENQAGLFVHLREEETLWAVAVLLHRVCGEVKALRESLDDRTATR